MPRQAPFTVLAALCILIEAKTGPAAAEEEPPIVAARPNAPGGITVY